MTDDQLPLDELAAAVGLPLASYRPAHVRLQLERAKARAEVASWNELLLRIKRDDQARARIRRAAAVSVTGPKRTPTDVARALQVRSARASASKKSHFLA